MEKKEFINLIEKKYNQISKIEDEIKELLKEYAKENTSFKEGDIVTSSTFINKNITFKCTGEFDYQLNIDSIIVDLEVISTNYDNIKIGDIYSISEKFLSKI